MRATTVLRKMLGITQVFVRGFRFTADGLIVEVEPSWKHPRCGECRERAPRYDRADPRRWRGIGIGRLRLWLEYSPRRVSCSRCGVRIEAVPWARHRSRFTRDFEELCAHLARSTDKTTVRNLLGIAWSTVGRIADRIVAERLEDSRFDGLRRIGIDEFSYRRRHRYLTIVVDHDRKRVVWAGAGSQYETLREFFSLLGPDRCAEIEAATIDMCAGYRKAVRENLPNAEVVFDRYHVQQLASDAVDQVRREQLRELRGTPEGRELFNSRFVLLKNPWDLGRSERQKLRDIEKSNAPLFRAYLLKETLARALDYRQARRAERALKDWLRWACRSNLEPFIRISKTIRKHFAGVLAYVQHRLTNGIVEGFNSKHRMIARRAYGFHGPEPLIALIHLCSGGIRLDPPLPGPTGT